MIRESKQTAPRNRSPCPVNLFLEMLGDRWSLLILRDLMFGDKHEFGDFLSAREGIATNVLADRLRKLEGFGLLGKRPHPSDARKFVYTLTMKGADLAPTLIEMALWTARYEKVEIPQELSWRMREDRAGLVADLRARVSKMQQSQSAAACESAPRPVK